MIRKPYALQLVFVLSVLLLGASGDANSAENYLPAIGGGGGSQFLAPCSPGENLAGFDLRAGDDIDAILPLCVTINSLGGVTHSVPAKGVLGPLSAPRWNGGTGGDVRRLACPQARPVVVAMYVGAEGVNTVTVNNIHLYCGLAVPSQTLDANPSAIFDAPAARPSSGAFGIGSSEVKRTNAFQRCPEGQVATGINGRSGVWLDAVGLICDTPRIVKVGTIPGQISAALPKPDVKLGKVEPPPGSPPTTDNRTICESAAAARARNSPAAPGLEAQCKASGEGVALGKVAVERSNGPSISICDAAVSAYQRNSPAASGLEKQCRELGGGAALDRAIGTANPDELASKGEAIAAADPQLSTLREWQPEPANRRGFDIGVAACEEDTAWGPGKQRILDTLSPPEQEGFKIAATFSLDRNRNAILAAAGLAIDETDPALAKARNAEADARYGLGFDIATGLFGDPKLGAQGNTVMGPGSLAIRDALSPTAQRGFDASVKQHFARHY